MSQQGIEIAAEALNSLQIAREKLFRLGSIGPSEQVCQQDIHLAHMLNEGNDAIKDTFCQITLEDES